MDARVVLGNTRHPLNPQSKWPAQRWRALAWQTRPRLGARTFNGAPGVVLRAGLALRHELRLREQEADPPVGHVLRNKERRKASTSGREFLLRPRGFLG